MEWAKITVDVEPAQSEAILGRMLELGAGGVEEIDPGSFTSLQAELPSELRLEGDLPSKHQLIAYWPVAKAEQVKLQLKEFPGVLGVRSQRVTDAKWLKTNTIGFKELFIGNRWVVFPQKGGGRSDSGRIPIYLAPGQAFGTGLHPTTQLVLEFLEEIPVAEKALDAGTGSGILAIALGKLGCADITACDLDPVAVEVAKQNLEQNGIKAQVLQVDPRKLTRRGFSLITANILAEVISELAPAFSRLAKPGGNLIASGIIAHKAEEVEKDLRKVGYSIVDRKEKENWVALLARLGEGHQ